MQGSSTAVLHSTEEALSSSHTLNTSVSSLSSSQRGISEISKIYKQASNLFLTRRLSEAFAIIEPLVTPFKPSDEQAEEKILAAAAPVSNANRKERIKVWSFYLTLLNTIAELDPEEGRQSFGNKQWKCLVAKSQDGSIWDEVVQIGYHGIEGSVDADVVINLATLLLAQSSTQKTTQDHLELYLSASVNPTLDLSSHFREKKSLNGHASSRSHRRNATTTPQDLSTWIKLIELFTLHVLPRNGEIEYARSFINNSEVLDDDVKENFLETLQNLENDDGEEQEHFGDASRRHNNLTEQDPYPAEDTEQESVDTVRQHPISQHHRPDSDKDYGIDSASTDVPKPASLSPKPITKPNRFIPPKSIRSPSATCPRKPSNASLYKRSLALMTAIQQMISRMTGQVVSNPMALLRFVLFLTGLIMAFSQRDVKDRLGRLSGAGWDKLKKTVGMGVKVSYI